MSTPTVGFVGLGKMGTPMVRRLLAAGFEVIGANRSQEIVGVLAGEGMIPASDASAVAERADVILTALPNEPSVEEVSMALLAGGHEGQVVVEHSTISPGLARRLAAEFSNKGIGYIDAPVSGGPAGADAGKLTVMVGGSADLLEKVRPVLAAFGDPIRHCGDVGYGEAIKLVNQLLVGIHTSAAAEAAAFGAAMGLDFDKIAEVIGTSFGSSAMLARNLPRFSAADYRPATPVSLLSKDLSLIQTQAGELDVPLHLGTVAERLFDEAAAEGLAAEDMAALFKLWSSSTADG